MPTAEILNSHPLSTLKKEISKTNIKGYSKMKKPELVKLMLKNKEKFHHIKMKTKEPVKKVIKVKKEKSVPKAKPATPKPAPVQGPRNLVKGFGIKRLPKKEEPKKAPAAAPKKETKLPKWLANVNNTFYYYKDTKTGKPVLERPNNYFNTLIPPLEAKPTALISAINYMEDGDFGRNLKESLDYEKNRIAYDDKQNYKNNLKGFEKKIADIDKLRGEIEKGRFKVEKTQATKKGRGWELLGLPLTPQTVKTAIGFSKNFNRRSEIFTKPPPKNFIKGKAYATDDDFANFIVENNKSNLADLLTQTELMRRFINDPSGLSKYIDSKNKEAMGTGRANALKRELKDALEKYPIFGSLMKNPQVKKAIRWIYGDNKEADREYDRMERKVIKWINNVREWEIWVNRAGEQLERASKDTSAS